MTELLDAYPPVTNNIGFINAGIKKVVRACNKWLLPQGGYSKPEWFRAGIDEAIERLFPLTHWQILFVECQRNWTAVFRDIDDVPEGPVAVVTERLKCRGVISTFVPQTISEDMTSGSWGAIQLRVYEDRPTEYRNIGRTISLTNQCGRWRFDLSGEPLPCEDVDRYQAKMVKDRFNLDMLLENLDDFGIKGYRHRFYTEQCALYHPPAPTYTGTELRINGKVIRRTE
ncbi:MAG: hypothetical protein KDA93_11650 [Planctomycetaceae bacterium]|nr:hypothetical protein [Planctomycetaceae bacterium]